MSHRVSEQRASKCRYSALPVGCCFHGVGFCGFPWALAFLEWVSVGFCLWEWFPWVFVFLGWVSVGFCLRGVGFLWVSMGFCLLGVGFHWFPWFLLLFWGGFPWFVVFFLSFGGEFPWVLVFLELVSVGSCLPDVVSMGFFLLEVGFCGFPCFFCCFGVGFHEFS